MSSIIGGYQITSTIGAGGMGMVYLAQHELLGRKAALKVLLPEYSHDQEVVGRFFGEAKASTAIKHPGIVKVYDFGFQGDGTAFIAMEYLEGEPLDARLRRLGPLPVLSALRFAGQMASALAAAHGHGIVHRDLKPANVFIVPDPQVPGGERIKLLDFGIAKFSASDDPRSNHTRAGAIMGSPAYMAPEQCRGMPDVDPRADLYSVGCMLLEMLTGRPPFDGGGAGALAIMSAHLHDPPPVPSSLRADIPREVDALILYLLAKDPAQRYQTAADLGYALAAVSGEQVSFSSLPGVTAEHAAGTWPSGVGLSPTGQPLNASQVATLRGATAPGHPTQQVTRPGAGSSVTQITRPRRAGLWIALIAATFVGGGLALAGMSSGSVPLPIVDMPKPVVAAPEPIRRAPPAPAYSFRQLKDGGGASGRRTTAGMPADPGATEAPVPSALDGWNLPPISFTLSGLFSGGLLRDVFGTLVALAARPPRIVTWTISSTPSGATVFDGATAVGTTPLVTTFSEVPGHVANFVLRADGHDDATVQLIGTEDFDQTIALVPRQPVSVESKPPGASIVDASGAVLGVTPVTVLLSRSTEAVALTLRLDGHDDQPLSVVPDGPRKERIKLTKTRAQVVVRLESVPPGGTILKNGKVIGTTPYDDQFLEVEDKVQYTVRLDGYREQAVRVAGNKSATKTVTLKPKAQPKKRPCKPSNAAPSTKPAIYDVYGGC